MVLLLPDLPFHSFPAQLSALKPSSMTLKEFVGRIQKFEKLLVTTNPGLGLFQTRELKLTVSWTSILPLDLTAEVVGQIQVKQTPPTIDPDIIRCSLLQACKKDLHSLQSPLLITLETAMSEDINSDFRMQEMIYAKICAELQQHIVEPQRYASPIQPDTISKWRACCLCSKPYTLKWLLSNRSSG